MRRLLIPALALFAVACADSPAHDSADTDAGPTVALELTVGDFLFLEGVEGLDVCVMNTDNCTVTDEDGLAILTVAADSDIGVTIAGEDYTPTLLPYRTTSEDLVVSIYPSPMVITELVHGHLGLDWSKGHVTVTLHQSEGFVAEIETGEAVHYWNDLSSALDADLTQTSQSGRMSVVNVSGDTVMTISGPGNCTPRVHYWSDGPNRVVLPILSGHKTGVTLDCE